MTFPVFSHRFPLSGTKGAINGRFLKPRRWLAGRRRRVEFGEAGEETLLHDPRRRRLEKGGEGRGRAVRRAEELARLAMDASVEEARGAWGKSDAFIRSMRGTSFLARVLKDPSLATEHSAAAGSNQSSSTATRRMKTDGGGFAGPES